MRNTMTASDTRARAAVWYQSNNMRLETFATQGASARMALFERAIHACPRQIVQIASIKASIVADYHIFHFHQAFVKRSVEKP
jgi:hypothetical protein